MPSKSESGQRPASRHTLSTRRWRQQRRAQEKGRSRLNHPHFHLREEESEHEHEDTSTSEDDMLKLLGIPDDTQNASTRERKLFAPRHPRDPCERMLWHDSRLMTKLVT